MWILLALAIIIGGGIWLFIKLRNSKFVDNLTDGILHEKDNSFKSTNDLIQSANEAKDSLDKRVEDNTKAAEVLEKETENILKYQGKDTEQENGKEQPMKQRNDADANGLTKFEKSVEVKQKFEVIF